MDTTKLTSEERQELMAHHTMRAKQYREAASAVRSEQMKIRWTGRALTHRLEAERLRIEGEASRPS